MFNNFFSLFRKNQVIPIISSESNVATLEIGIKQLLLATINCLEKENDIALCEALEKHLLNLSSNQWVKIDVNFRSLANNYNAQHQREYFLSQLKSLRSPSLTLILTMWPDGYVREAAVKMLRTEDHALSLPVLFLRLNDWSNEIQKASLEALYVNLPKYQFEELIAQLPLLVRLKICDRHLPRELYLELITAVKNRIPILAFKKTLIGGNARATAEIIWDIDSKNPEMLCALCQAPDSFIRFYTLRNHVKLMPDDKQLNLLLNLPKTHWTPAKLERLKLLQKLDYAQIQDEWIRGLTDGSESIRQHCRFHLKRLAYNIEEHYLQVLSDISSQRQRASLFGLSELDQDKAIPIVNDWLKSGDSNKLIIALRLIDEHSANKNIDLIINSLKSADGALRKSAYLAALKTNNYSLFEPLAWDLTLPKQSQVYASQIITKSNLWYSILKCLQLIKHSDEKIALNAQYTFERLVARLNFSFVKVNTETAEEILNELDRCQLLIKPSLAEMIKCNLNNN